MKIFYAIFILCLLMACQSQHAAKSEEDVKAEIIAVEKAFEQKLASDGIAKAFLHYAAPNAVLHRNNKLIKGKAEIEAYFASQTLKDIKLSWLPDSVEVSACGDMASTYGNYNFSAINEQGDSIHSKGIFHTVWKRQENGEWKFIWD